MLGSTLRDCAAGGGTLKFPALLALLLYSRFSSRVPALDAWGHPEGAGGRGRYPIHSNYLLYLLYFFALALQVESVLEAWEHPEGVRRALRYAVKLPLLCLLYFFARFTSTKSTDLLYFFARFTSTKSTDTDAWKHRGGARGRGGSLSV